MGKRKKLKVAITGSIGSGKTTFCNFLKEKDYPVLVADDLSKEILLRDQKAKKAIIDSFGSEVYSGNRINKKFLADKIFSDPKKLKKINSILHPLVRKKIEVLTDKFFLKSDFIFIEAAIIYESGIEKMYDYVVLISADAKIRERRVIKSNKFSKEDFNKRTSLQLDEDSKIKKADFVFYNNGTRKELRQKAMLLVSILKSYNS
jgi:dephospho-CoA kinase